MAIGPTLILSKLIAQKIFDTIRGFMYGFCTRDKKLLKGLVSMGGRIHERFD